MATTTSPGRTRSGTEQPVGLDDARGGAGDVVLVGGQQAGVLGGLAADQRAAGLDARLGDALDDRRDPLGDDLAGGDVVGHEQRLGAADAPGRRRPCRPGRSRSCRGRPSPARSRPWCRRRRWRWPAAGWRVLRQRGGVEEPGEAAQAADHLGPTGLLDRGLHQLDGPVGGVDVDAGLGVRVASGDGVAPVAVVDLHGLLSTGGSRPMVGDFRVRLEEVLAEQRLVGQLDGVLAGEAGAAERRLAAGRWPPPCRRARCSRGCRRRRWRRSPRGVGPVGDQLRAGRRSRCRRSTATSPAGWRCGTCTSRSAGLAEHPHLGALGVAAHDRVVDDHDPLAADHVLAAR